MVEHFITQLSEGIKASHGAGPWLFFVLFVVANIALVPASLLSILAGCVCGFGPGFVVTALARPFASAVGFLLTRRWLGDWARARAARFAWLDAVDRALSSGGLRVMLLLRLSPAVPSTTSSYLLGLTRIDFKVFLLGTVFGTLPSTILYTYLGAALPAITRIGEVEPGKTPMGRALFWVGLAATLAVVFIVQRLARRELALLLAAQAQPQPQLQRTTEPEPAPTAEVTPPAKP